MIKVFYDGNCSICNREINFYKKLNSASTILWFDIHKCRKELKIIKKTKKTCLKSLHVVDDKHNIYTEVDAFLIIYKNISSLKFLYYLFNFKMIKFFLNFFYRIFDNYRYKKLYDSCKL